MMFIGHIQYGVPHVRSVKAASDERPALQSCIPASCRVVITTICPITCSVNVQDPFFFLLSCGLRAGDQLVPSIIF